MLTPPLVLRYTAYHRVNGGTGNDDGFGRRARDNDTLYLGTWLVFLSGS